MVPIKTGQWASQLKGYRDHDDYRDRILDDASSEQFLVRDGVGFDAGVGPGLMGVCGENLAAHLYDTVAERAQLKKDFDAGVIPFYEYDFTSGRVTHNGRHVWNGLTVDQAIGALLDRFDPTGQSRLNAGL